MNSADYSRLARRYAERAPTTRPFKLDEPQPLLSAALRFGKPVHTPSASQPLAIVESSIDGRLFALSEGDEGITVVEVER